MTKLRGFDRPKIDEALQLKTANLTIYPLACVNFQQPVFTGASREDL